MNNSPVVRQEIITKKVSQILYNRLGTNLGSGEPYLETLGNRQVWVVPLLADCPRIINDRRTESLKHIIYRIGEIGEIKLDAKTIKPLAVPNRSELNETIHKEMLTIRKRVEDLLLRTASINYARLVTTKHLMSPLTNLITNILKHHQYEIPETQYGQNIYRYVSVLEKRDFAKVHGNFVYPSGLLTELFNKMNNSYNKTQEIVLKDLIENEYDILYRKYGIRILYPYIRVPSTYYDYAISSQDLIGMSEDDLWLAYTSSYGSLSSRTRFRFTEWLREMCQEGINLLYETSKGYYEGNPELFEEMLKNIPETVQSGRMII
jgi:hypothetical protein